MHFYMLFTLVHCDDWRAGVRGCRCIYAHTHLTTARMDSLDSRDSRSEALSPRTVESVFLLPTENPPTSARVESTDSVNSGSVDCVGVEAQRGKSGARLQSQKEAYRVYRQFMSQQAACRDRGAVLDTEEIVRIARDSSQQGQDRHVVEGSSVAAKGRDKRTSQGSNLRAKVQSLSERLEDQRKDMLRFEACIQRIEAAQQLLSEVLSASQHESQGERQNPGTWGGGGGGHAHRPVQYSEDRQGFQECPQGRHYSRFYSAKRGNAPAFRQ